VFERPELNLRDVDPPTEEVGLAVRTILAFEPSGFFLRDDDRTSRQAVSSFISLLNDGERGLNSGERARGEGGE
jgi:hypothetical protein